MVVVSVVVVVLCFALLVKSSGQRREFIVGSNDLTRLKTLRWVKVIHRKTHVRFNIGVFPVLFRQ